MISVYMHWFSYSSNDIEYILLGVDVASIYFYIFIFISIFIANYEIDKAY